MHMLNVYIKKFENRSIKYWLHLTVYSFSRMWKVAIDIIKTFIRCKNSFESYYQNYITIF